MTSETRALIGRYRHLREIDVCGAHDPVSVRECVRHSLRLARIAARIAARHPAARDKWQRRAAIWRDDAAQYAARYAS